MAKQTARPYQEGSTWSVRVRVKGYDQYLSGFKTAEKAACAAESYRRGLDKAGKPAGRGPERTTLAVALQDYGREVLHGRKGADQEARRINAYLRAADLPALKLTAVPRTPNATLYWEVALEDKAQRRMVNSLRKHRKKLEERGRQSAAMRKRLSCMNVSAITPHDVQALLRALQLDNYAASTIFQERAILRGFFTYAQKAWSWTLPATNPASAVKGPRIDNARDRILSNSEWAALQPALERYRNPYALPVIRMLLTTAMRASEPLVYARWCDVDWDRNVLQLFDGKYKGRMVPLPPEAVAVLRELQAKTPDAAPGERIFPTTYEAVKKAWTTACAEAKVKGVRLHDLRHTAATRYALEFGGNIPILQLITGHKTLAMLQRYINLRPEMVACMMHDAPMKLGDAPAGYVGPRSSEWTHKTGMLTVKDDTEPTRPTSQSIGNVVHATFGKRSAA